MTETLSIYAMWNTIHDGPLDIWTTTGSKQNMILLLRDNITVQFCVFCANVSTKVTRNKDIYSVTYDNPGNVSFNDKPGTCNFSLYYKQGKFSYW
jgi:hypothetical protein